MTTLPITSADDALKIGQMIARSGTFGVNTDEAGAVIALMCHQEGISLLKFQRTYHMMGNKPTMKADAMLAQFVDNGGGFDLIERSESRAAIEAWRENGKKHKFELSIEEVKKAGYCYSKDGKTMSNTWRQYPKAMLWARLVSDMVRALDPRVNAGIYTQEEMQDVQEPAPEPENRAPKSSEKVTPPKIESITETKPEPSKAEPEKPAPASADPFENLPEDETDYTVCPAGKNKGKKFVNMEEPILQAILKDETRRSKGITEKHEEEIKKALEDDVPF